MSLAIDINTDLPGRVVFKLTGRLDTQTTPQLDQLLDPHLESAAKTIVFDLEGLEYISSAGLRAVFRSKQTLATRAGTVLVVNPQPPVQKVFDIVQAMPTASIFTSWEELDEYLDTMQEKVREEGGDAI